MARANQIEGRGAPLLNSRVTAKLWSHYCSVKGEDVFMAWDEPSIYPKAEDRKRGAVCHFGCGARVQDTTILYDSSGKRIEMVCGGNEMGRDRYKLWWMLCCKCHRYEANGLGDNYPRIQKIVGKNCCDHCKDVNLDYHACRGQRRGERGGCLAYNKWGEVVKYMNSDVLPENSIFLRDPWNPRQWPW
ncbi:hypothetical protein QBC38DRAFT_541813 [Podospora fimiseda]|uniref:Uncharacterized protein n=1 Tax=Podospora fimiseda TaxID=252190 RepID=A0AAN7BX65_9PEZI|nr:hypothetical protein QBC38DRAFT_541813 [Podospora fimiseda]